VKNNTFTVLGSQKPPAYYQPSKYRTSFQPTKKWCI